MSQQPIVILGAGIAGLTLGRCLKQRGIPSIIYERATSAPRYSYGITLHQWAYKPLLQLLDIDDHSFRRQIAVDSQHHAGTGKLYPNESTHPLDEFTRPFRANRSKLEQLLHQGLQIKWEHDLVKVETSSDGSGSTNLTFQNNLRLSSSFIIDTLGVHSPLRNSLSPDCNPKVLPYAVFSGRGHVKKDEFLRLYAPHFKDGNILSTKPAEGENILLQIWINDYQPSGDVQTTYVYSRPARADHDQHPPDPLHNPGRSTATATQIPSAFYHELERLATSAKLPEPFPSTFAPSKVRNERTLHWLMRSLLVPASVLRTLLVAHSLVMAGDSAHATPILGGHGANHAMKDAMELAEVIAASNSASDESRQTTLDKDAVWDYYEKCAKRWTEEVAESDDRIAEMHSRPA